MGKHRNSRLTATWLLGTIAAAAIMAGDQAQAADCMEMGGSDGQKCLAIASALDELLAPTDTGGKVVPLRKAE